MGRANVYLPDELERRVKAARIPVSEVCQQALLAAVEAAESAAATRSRLDPDVGDWYARGGQAGLRWAQAASAVELLALLRDQRLDPVPADQLPDSWFSLREELTTAWEAGFAEAARSAARNAVADAATGPSEPDAAAPEAAGTVRPAPPAGDADAGSAEPAVSDGLGTDREARLGDGSTSYVGVDHAGRRVAFDPHAAVADDKSPLFAVLGPADQRARLALSVGQDAACRGVAVVVLDLSGQLTPRARGLSRIVRIPSAAQPAMPGLDALLGGAGIRGLFDVLGGLSAAGGGLFPPAMGAAQELVTPGYVTVLPVSGGEGPFGGVLAGVNALRVLGELTARSEHPRLLLADLPSGVAVPGQFAGPLGKFVRTARQNGVALGLSAQSADAVADVGGAGALLSTVFAFPTSSPAEADRLRDLLGAGAPILLNPPGFVPGEGDEQWCTMRDLTGRLGQVRLDAS